MSPDELDESCVPPLVLVLLVSPILLVRHQTALEYMDNNTPAAPANKPAIENMDVKYAQCMMHSALSSFTNHLLEGGVDH